MGCVHLNRIVAFASCPFHQGATQNEGIFTVKEAARMLDVALSNIRVWGASGGDPGVSKSHHNCRLDESLVIDDEKRND